MIFKLYKVLLERERKEPH